MKNPAIVITGFLAITICVALLSLRSFAKSPADLFRHITGYDFPEGFRIVSYQARRNDILFHQGHFWKFAHSPSEFERFIGATHFQRSEDAIWMLPGFEAALGSIESSSIQTGYELEKDRDDWILLEKGESFSYYNAN